MIKYQDEQIETSRQNVNNNDKIPINEITTTEIKKPETKGIINVRIVKNPKDTNVTNNDIKREAGIIIKPKLQKILRLRNLLEVILQTWKLQTTLGETYYSHLEM